MREIYIPSRAERDSEEEYKKNKYYLSRVDKLISQTLSKDDWSPTELDKLLKLRDKIKTNRISSST